MKSTEHNISLLSPSVTVKPGNQVAERKHQSDSEPALNLLTLTSSSAVNILIKKIPGCNKAALKCDLWSKHTKSIHTFPGMTAASPI